MMWSRMSSRSVRRPEAGFTLAELAIVLLIVGLLIGGLLMPLSAQIDSRRTADTQNSLMEIREALLGFAMAQGRLPCPAKADDTGVEDPPGGGVGCTHAFDGYVPGITLSINPTDPQGYATDAWGNRIRYSVTTVKANSFTKINGMKNTTIQSLDPDLRVCSSATGITPDKKCANPETSNVLTNSAVAVILSVGANGASGSHGTDETANLDGDRVFVYHTPTPAGAANGEFDDIVTWLSPNILYNRMIAAGQLP
jgi:type II secretory pathway pseudopilin PulG